MHKRRPAFTLIELLVVIAIIAILIALLVPAVQKVREASNRTQCANSLKQLGLAIHAHHEANAFIPYTRVDPKETWALLLLPYLEQQNLYNLWDPKLTYYQQSQNFRHAMVPVFYCPTRRAGSNEATNVSTNND